MLIAALVVVVSLGGCGQKGPLFLPQDKLDELERKRDEREADKVPAEGVPAEGAPAKTGRLAPAPAAVVVA